MFEILLQQSIQDIDAPYRRYRLLRENSPVLKIASKRERDTYLITRHEDVAKALRDPRLSKIDASDGILKGASPTTHKLGAIIRNRKSMFRSDPPDHTRLRKIVGQGMIQRGVLELEPLIRSHTRQLLLAVDIGRPFDAVDKLTRPLPIFVIGKLLGIPKKDHSQLQIWAKNLLPFFEGLEFIEKPESVLKAVLELDDYLEGKIAILRSKPDSSLVSKLVYAGEEKKRLTDAEIKATVQLLILAGNATTSDFLSNGLYRLSKNTNVLQAVYSDPTLLPNALEEILRLDSPIQITGYITKELIEFQKISIPPNTYLALNIGSANRDPRVFANPNELDIHRKNTRNLCFGGGIHMCVGAGLARMIGKVFFEEFFSLANDKLWRVVDTALRQSFTLRGFEHLKIDFVRKF